jgi:hypothetical protein
MLKMGFQIAIFKYSVCAESRNCPFSAGSVYSISGVSSFINGDPPHDPVIFSRVSPYGSPGFAIRLQKDKSKDSLY